MKNLKLFTLIISLLLGVLNLSRADLLDQLLSKPGQSTNQSAPALSPGGLSAEQMAGGLKEALGKGVQSAISRLGHDGGFLTNLNVKIPMPEKLRTVEKTLRTLKQEKLADDFVHTMNHAADRAADRNPQISQHSYSPNSIYPNRAGWWKPGNRAGDQLKSSNGIPLVRL